jgi:phage FluMu protein Com
MGTRQIASSARLLEPVGTMRQCSYCGKLVARNRSQCPHCRETLSETGIARVAPATKRSQIRRGLLYMLLAAVIHYFAGGYSAIDLPFPIIPAVAVYLSSLLFLGGLGLTLYGFYLRIRE